MSRDGQRSDPVDLVKSYLRAGHGHGVVADSEAGSGEPLVCRDRTELVRFSRIKLC